MFLNQLQIDKTTMKGEPSQTSLVNILQIMDLMTNDLADKASSVELTREQVIELVDKRKLSEWNLDTAKKIIINGT